MLVTMINIQSSAELFVQELMLEESDGDSEDEGDDFLRDSVDREAVAASNALSSPGTPQRTSEGSMITKARKKVIVTIRRNLRLYSWLSCTR